MDDSPYPRLAFAVDAAYLDDVRRLPWEAPIGRWRDLGVRHDDVRRGEGRHPVVFVRTGGRRLVVKELSAAGARREVETYRRLQDLGVPSLTPLGWVTREERPIAVASPVGTLYEPDVAGHTLTLLAPRVLPDSRVYSLALRPDQRRRIADAVVDLFVDLHVHGVFWGDASLYNLLIQFVQVEIPQLGRRTRYRALLADAETVEIHPALSPGLRRADLEQFVESMRWINEDLRVQGVVREALAGEADRAYLEETYARRYEVAVGARAFAAATGLDPERVLGHVDDPAYLNALRKHIDEHRWHLGERAGREVPLAEAAADWLETIFLPLCDLFRREEVIDLFPAKTAAELYVDVMTHKYFLSREQGRDVGIALATHDYAERFGAEPTVAAFWRGIAEKLRQLVGRREGGGGEPVSRSPTP